MNLTLQPNQTYKTLQSENTYNLSSFVSNFSTNNFVILKLTICHFRLGHVSQKRIKPMFQFYSSFVFDNNATCDACHFVNKKLPFNTSEFIPSIKI